MKEGKKSVEVSSPIKAGDLVLGRVRIGVNTDWMSDETVKTRGTIIYSMGAALAIVFLGVLISSSVARRISEPILLLKEAAEGIGKGDYDQKVDIKSGDEIGVLADTFNRMAAEIRDSRNHLVEKEALLSSEARLKEAQQIAHIGNWDWDITTNKIEWSDELYRIYGYEPGEIAPDYALVVGALHPDSRDEFFRVLYAALRGERPYETDYVFFRKDGSEAVLHAIGKVVYDESGAARRMVGTVQDVTAQRRAEEALRGSEEKLRTFFESANDAIFMLDLEGNFIDVNRAAHERLGYSREEMLSMNLAQIDPPDFAVRVPERIRRVVMQRQAVFETAHMRKDGSVMPVEVNARAMKLRGKEVIFSVIRDITDRKAAEEMIKSALSEKEILLKEIHHRVKNNLQVVASLIDLQSHAAEDDKTRLLFEESQKRIETMSLIHEKLYRSKDLAKLDFKEYVDDLIANVVSLHTHCNEQITLKTDICGGFLDIENAVPCGLIINELVTNALRHAFAGRKTGDVSVRLYSAGSDMLTLSVSDNGKGFPDGLDFKNTKSLGMQLVISLVAQLGGEIELRRGQGTAFTITFPRVNDRGRN